MCGLAGIWHRDGRAADEALLERMMAPMQHRGPDARGTWREGGLALGHLRLTILDPAARANQPMITADGDGVLVYNGEVYNFPALRAELEEEGARLRSTADSEVVLEALHRWGPERAIPRFDGMFAFAYFDRRSGTLWLARDRLGIKPLHVAERGSTLLFASEVRGLRAHPAIEVRPRMQAVLLYVLRGRTESRFTAFEGIEGVEAGSWWKVTASGVARHRYFHVLDVLDAERIVTAARERPARFVEAFEEAFAESVRTHLVSDVPLAAMCSGGVDSSLVTAHASRHVPGLRGYVANLEWKHGEGERARQVGRHLGVDMTVVSVSRELHLRLWPEAVAHNEHPCYHTSDMALLAVARRCRADGVKVVLTGEGSDELFCGYRWQVASGDLWRRRRGHGRSPLAPLISMPGRHSEWLRRRLMVAMDLQAELRGNAIFEKLAPVRSRFDRAFLAQALDDLYRHLDVILRRHDRMGMAASLEMRVPFLSNRVIDLALHLPRRAKYHRRQGKWVVKRAALTRIPKPIVYAGKKGFWTPPEFENGTETILREGAAAELLCWPAATVERAVDLCAQDGWMRFHLVGVELWAQIHLLGRSPADLGERLLAAAAG